MSSLVIKPFEIVVHDLESDGFLDVATKVHCGTVICMSTGEVAAFRPHEVWSYVDLLSQAKVILGHNIIAFDNPLLEKLLKFIWEVERCWDTLVVARCLFPDRPQGHSLKSYGQALGILKGDFGETADWSQFTEEMFTYNIQDTKVNEALAKAQLKQTGIRLEELLEMDKWLKLNAREITLGNES